MTKSEQDKAYAAAAGQIAGAVATAYMGPGAGAVVDTVVTEIAGALLSGDDDKVQSAILGRLDEINGKVDQILYFCNHGFRDIVDQELDDKAIEQMRVDIVNDQVMLTDAMRAYSAARPPTEDDSLRLIEKAEQTLATGRRIFARSRDHYLVAVPYFAQALAALLIVQRRTRKYVGAAATWANQYKKDLTPWMTQGTEGSFLDVRTQIQNQINVAQSVMKDFVVGQPVRYINFLMPVYVPVADPFGGFPLAAGPVTTFAYGAQYVLNADYTLSVQHLRVVGSVPRAVAVTEDMQTVFGMASNPSFPPRSGSERNDAYWHDVYSFMYSPLGAFALQLKALPPRRDALDFAIKVLEPFISGLSQLSGTIAHQLVDARAQVAA